VSGTSESNKHELPTGVSVKDAQFASGGNDVDTAQWHS
jgi:hypothetical protein